mgnify:CR=1 FL=1
MPGPDPEGAADNAALVRDMLTLFERLEAVLAAETAALRAGRLRDALRLGTDKSSAFAAYETLLPLLREAREAGRIAPVDRAALRRKQEGFEQAVDLNLAVLSTVRSVAEDVLREVAQSVAPPAPQAYGPPGSSRPAPASAPIALSRSS